jgi:hypothetical protein
MSKFKIITKGIEVIVRHKSTILKVLGIAGVGLAIADATIQGPKAKEALDKAQEEKGEEPLTTFEKVKIAGPILARPVALGAAGVASLCTGYNIQVKELTKNCANLATAYNGLQAGTKVLQEDFKNYKEATKETVGEEKEKEIQNVVNDKIIKSIPASSIPQKPADHPDWVLYVERYSRGAKWGPKPGPHFEPPLFVREAIVTVKSKLNDDGECPLNSYLEALNMPTSPVTDNYIIKPSAKNSYGAPTIEATVYESTIIDGQPAILIDLSSDPFVPDYNSYSPEWR